MKDFNQFDIKHTQFQHTDEWTGLEWEEEEASIFLQAFIVVAIILTFVALCFIPLVF